MLEIAVDKKLAYSNLYYTIELIQYFITLFKIICNV